MNPTILPDIDFTRCDCPPGSLPCVRGCPSGALGERNGRPFFLHPELCSFCAGCEGLCPRQAIHCAYEIVWDAPGWQDKT